VSTCKHCRYNLNGVCRRYPQKIRVNEADWCGEYQGKPQESPPSGFVPEDLSAPPPVRLKKTKGGSK